jgi:hypothetical protein
VELHPVVDEAHHAVDGGDGQGEPDEWIREVTPEQAGGDERDDEQRAAHGGGAALLEVALGAVVAHDLADLLELELADEPGVEQQAGHQRGEQRGDGAEHRGAEQAEDPGVVGLDFVEPVKH